MTGSFARLSLLAAVAAAAVSPAPLGAEPGPQLPPVSAAPERAGVTLAAAWTQRSVPIGRVSVAHTWRCSNKQGDTVYFTTGYTESAARATLESFVGHRVSCFRRDVFPFGLMF